MLKTTAKTAPKTLAEWKARADFSTLPRAHILAFEQDPVGVTALAAKVGAVVVIGSDGEVCGVLVSGEEEAA